MNHLLPYLVLLAIPVCIGLVVWVMDWLNEDFEDFSRIHPPDRTRNR